MNILIIEDEEPAAKRLEKMLLEINPQIKIIETIVSVKSAVKWLNENKMPDMIMMDIQLADGESFEIFKEVKITCPVIFTTAFDQYALEAFKVSSIDYLLKPIKKADLERSFEKYFLFKHPAGGEIPDYQKLVDMISEMKTGYQKRLIIRYGEHIKTVEIEQVAYFYTEEKYNFLITFDNKTYPVDYNLDQLEHMIDPKIFFRINRQFIVNFNAIEKMTSFSKSRVNLTLKPPSHFETIVSTERSPHFKDWLTGQ